MSHLEQSLQTTRLVERAERDLGASLQTSEARVLSASELALKLCVSSPEYTSGPFVGFRSVLKKRPQNHSDASAFMTNVQILDGRALLLPFPDQTIRRVLVRSVATDRVGLTVFDEPARIHVTNAERTLLSAVNAYDDPTVGTHLRGIKTEPGHVALASAAVLGAYELPQGTGLHGAVHTFEHKTGTARNILSTVARASSYVGARLIAKEFSYDTWPTAMELLWHPDERDVLALNDAEAAIRVQAAGFVSLREARREGAVVQALGAMV